MNHKRLARFNFFSDGHLDIWHHNKKVLNLDWDDQGEFFVVSYKPGDWEMLLPTVPVGFP